MAYSGKLGTTVVYAVTFGGIVSAFDSATRKLFWTRSVGANVEASPAVYNGTVYIGDLDGRLDALNAATGVVDCTFTLPVVASATTPGQIVSSSVLGVGVWDEPALVQNSRHGWEVVSARATPTNRFTL